MLFYCKKINTSIDEIVNAFDRYYENEQHNILLSIFEKFRSVRKGIHAYIFNNVIYGYYETGYTNNQNQASSIKNWFYIFLKEKDGVTYIKIFIFFAPIFFILLLASLVSTVLLYFEKQSSSNMSALVLASFIEGGSLIHFIKQQFIIRNELLRILKSTIKTAADDSRNSGDGSMC